MWMLITISSASNFTSKKVLGSYRLAYFRYLSAPESIICAPESIIYTKNPITIQLITCEIFFFVETMK